MARLGTLVVTTSSGEVRYGLDNPEVTLGRGAENDVVLLDLKVSRRHAVLHSAPGIFRLVDVGSSNGFKLNGVRTREGVVRPGDVVVIGATQVQVVAPGEINQEDATMMTDPGERFEAALTDHKSHKVVVMRAGGTHTVRLSNGRTVVGRQPGVDILVEHPRVSRAHAEVVVNGELVTLADLGSRNGTLLNGEVLTGTVELHNGDTFEVGDARMVFKAGFTQDDLSMVMVSPVARKLPQTPAATTAEVPQVQQRPRRAPVPDNQDTVEADDGGTSPSRAIPAVPTTPRRPRPPGRLPVVVVPGFMGSTLFRGDNMVWPAAKTFLKTPEMLKMPDNDDLIPRGLVEEVVVIPGLIKLDAYNRLVEYLTQGLEYQLGKDLFICAYDWRMDLRLGARTLGNLITDWEELPEKVPGKFILIGHSAGGLVSRYYVQKMGGRHHVERLILLGTPHLGTPKPLMSMLGGGGLPFGTNKQKLKETVATFLSAYQLLPNYPVVYDEKGPIDLLNDDTWLPEKAKLAIKDSREFHEELGPTSRVPVVSIFGYGQKTLARIDVKRGKDGEFVDPKFTDEECGDGTVSQESAILPGSEIHPVQQQHGALYTDNDVKMRLKLELLGRF